MSVRNADWYAGNATRNYPLDDAATAVDDAGIPLPTDLIADASLRYPGTGRMALSAAAATAGQVSLVFTVGGTAAAAVTVLKPVTPGIHYAVTAMSPGVGGWVVFGAGVNAPYSGRFSTDAQGLIAPKASRPYVTPPVPGIANLGSLDVLSGVVSLLAGPDVTIDYETVPLPITSPVTPVNTPAIVIRVKDAGDGSTLTAYAGACGARPESGTCDKTPLETINGVGPDCNGDIRLHFKGLTAYPFVGGGGAAIDLHLGVASACAQTAGINPFLTPQDLCSTGDIPSLGAESSNGDCGCLVTSGGTGLTLSFKDAAGTVAFPYTPVLDWWHVGRPVPNVRNVKCRGGVGMTAFAAPEYTMTCANGQVSMTRRYGWCSESVLTDTIIKPCPPAGGLFRLGFSFPSDVYLGSGVVEVTGNCFAPGMHAPAPQARRLNAARRPAVDEDMTNLPLARHGEWVDAGDWSAGVEPVPASSLGVGGQGRLVKLAYGLQGTNVAAFSPRNHFRVEGRVVSVLVRPWPGGSTNGGVAVGPYVGLVDLAASSLVLGLDTGMEKPNVLASVPLPSVPGGWYRVTLAVRGSPGSYRAVLSAFSPSGRTPAATLEASLAGLSNSDRFGLASSQSWASFGHFAIGDADA